jgi:hypothetical protein
VHKYILDEHPRYLSVQRKDWGQAWPRIGEDAWINLWSRPHSSGFAQNLKNCLEAQLGLLLIWWCYQVRFDDEHPYTSRIGIAKPDHWQKSLRTASKKSWDVIRWTEYMARLNQLSRESSSRRASFLGEYLLESACEGWFREQNLGGTFCKCSQKHLPILDSATCEWWCTSSKRNSWNWSSVYQSSVIKCWGDRATDLSETHRRGIS